MTAKSGRKKQRKPRPKSRTQRKATSIVATWNGTNRTRPTELGMKNKKPKNSPEFEKLKTDHAATLLELERMRSMLREEQERSRKHAGENLEAVLEAVRQKHKL